MSDKDDDILNLGPDENQSDTAQGDASQNAPAQRTVQQSTVKKKDTESISRRFYKRLPYILLLLLVGVAAILFAVKSMIDDGVHNALHGSAATKKAKPLGYAQQQSEIDSIKSILKKQVEKQAPVPASTTPKTHPERHHAGPHFGNGIPGDSNQNGTSQMAAKAAQIAASPIVALHGYTPSAQSDTEKTAYSNPDSPRAIQAKIAKLRAEQRTSESTANDNNLGIDQAEKLAMESAGLSEHAAGPSNSSDSQSEWMKQNSGQAGYGKIIPTLPKLRGVALYPGAIIPAVTISRLDTQTPGQITAQVTRTVYSNSGVIAIPAGSRLVGNYDGQVFNGQTRVMMSFTHVIFPGGKQIALQGMNSTGPRGTSGIDGNVNTHFWTALGSSLLVALITDGVNSIPNPNSQASGNTFIGTSSTSPSQAGAQVMENQAQKILSPYTNLQNTVTIPNGTPFRIMVNKTIMLPER